MVCPCLLKSSEKQWFGFIKVKKVLLLHIRDVVSSLAKRASKFRKIWPIVSLHWRNWCRTGLRWWHKCGCHSKVCSALTVMSSWVLSWWSIYDNVWPEKLPMYLYEYYIYNTQLSILKHTIRFFGIIISMPQDMEQILSEDLCYYFHNILLFFENKYKSVRTIATRI